MAKQPVLDATRDAVAEIAEYICARFREGGRGGIALGGVHFELTDVARCSEFVRECTEAAWGCGDHQLSTSADHPTAGPFFGGTARETEAQLRQHGIRMGEARRGYIVCFNAGAAGAFGHIGLCLGDGWFAENTSSTKRGPGFVVSDLVNMVGRVSGYYSVLPPRSAQPAPHDPPLLIGADGQKLCEGMMIEGSLWVPARTVVEGLGFGLVWHGEQGKAYVTEGEGKT